MKLNQLSDNPGARKNRTRVGRGIGSGKGKTAGRGGKGQTARSGVALKGFEGGQMPLFRRLPKRGFKNIFRARYVVVNLDRLQTAIEAKRLDASKPVDLVALQAAGIVNHPRDGIRLLGNGEIKAKLTIEVDGASKSAIAAIEKLGGSVIVRAPPAVAAKNEAKSAAKAKKTADAKPAAKPEAKAQAKPEKKTEAKTEAKAEGKTEGKTEGKAKEKARPKAPDVALE